MRGYTEVQKVIERLIDIGEIQKVKSDPYNIDRHLKSQYLVKNGIRLRIDQSHNRSNGIGFTINPSTFLSEEYQPVRLWKPTPESAEKLREGLVVVLKMLAWSRCARKI